jgi:selenocysteine lyase/cysteine desulfurase
MVKLSEIVPHDVLMDVQRVFSNEFNLSVVFEDTEGNLLVGDKRMYASDFRKYYIPGKSLPCMRENVCKKFIDKFGASFCKLSDATHARTAMDRKKPFLYSCHAKFCNFVIPIVVGEEVIANWFGGQFKVKRKIPPEIYSRLENLCKKDFEMTSDEFRRFLEDPSPPEMEELADKIGLDSRLKEEFFTEFAVELADENRIQVEKIFDHVKLLQTIANAISHMGNAISILSRADEIESLMTPELKQELSEKVAKLKSEVGSISIFLGADQIKHINNLAMDIIASVCDHEIEYVNKLLDVYREKVLVPDGNVAENIIEFLKVAFSYEVRYAEGYLDLYIDETLLATEREQKFLNAYDACKKKFYHIIDTLGKRAANEEEISMLQGAIRDLSNINQQMRREVTLTVKTDVGEMHRFLLNIVKLKRNLEKIRRIDSDRYGWASKVRDSLDLGYDDIYLNSGGLCPTHKDVRKSQYLWLEFREEAGPVSFYTEERLVKLLEECREKLGGLIKAEDAREILLTTNTTEGIQMVLNAIDFSENDEVIITDLEHDTVFFCCRARIKNAANIKIAKLSQPLCKFGAATEQCITEISSHLNDNTKLVIISGIAYCSGIRLDIQKIIKEIKNRTMGKRILFLIDAAQLIGQCDVDVKELDCDFLAFDGHKWLLGTEGSGALYIKKEFLEGKHKDVQFMPYKNFVMSTNFHPTADFLLDIEGIGNSKERKLELGTFNALPVAGMSAAIDIYNQVGIRKIQDRIIHLVNIARNRLKDAFGSQIEFISSDEPSHQSGLLCFTMETLRNRYSYEETVRTLADRFHVICRSIPFPPSIRICLHYFNSEIDIEIFVNALKRILEEGKVPEKAAKPFPPTKSDLSKEEESIKATGKGRRKIGDTRS